MLSFVPGQRKWQALAFAMLCVSSLWLVLLLRWQTASLLSATKPAHRMDRAYQTPASPQGTGDRPTLDDLQQLAKILEKKLSQFPSEKPWLTSITCARIKSAGNPCVNMSCPAKFSASPRVRLKQILATRNDSLRTYTEAMAEVIRRVQPHKYLFVSAVSANHYGEMQALVRNVQTELFPRLSNFTFLLFDLGLTSLQRNRTEKNCGCTVLDYPFDKMPSFFSELRCYTWKPNIIRSLIEKAEFLIWMDSSVRWNPDTPLDRIFRRGKERGLQLGISTSGSVGVRTDHDTFRFYGDQACQYEHFGEVWATYGVYHNEPFVRYAVLDPWLACAFSTQCMCVADHARKAGCRERWPRRAGVYHRFDQSSLGVIVSKLYGNRTNLIRVPNGIRMNRGQTADWFTR